MATSDAQKRAIRKYRKKIKEKYTDVRFKVTVEEKANIKKLAEENGESESSFIYKIVKNAIDI